MQTLRNPQPYGEQTTGPLKRNCISIFFAQCAHEDHGDQVTRKTLEMELIPKLIRSLRDDEQGKSWEPGAQVVAQSR